MIIDMQRHYLRDSVRERIEENERLVEVIREYWFRQGKNIEIHVCPKTAEIHSNIPQYWQEKRQ